jgi:stage V sporulation protein G
MNITDVRITLADEGELRAYCSITIDNALVIRDMRVIEMPDGLFVAMPSRKRRVPCTNGCGCKNPLGAAFCNRCGKPVRDQRKKFEHHFLDVAHPINAEARELIENKVLDAFDAALDKAEGKDQPNTESGRPDCRECGGDMTKGEHAPDCSNDHAG